MSSPPSGKTHPSRADSDSLEADTVEQLIIDAQSYDEVRYFALLDSLAPTI